MSSSPDSPPSVRQAARTPADPALARLLERSAESIAAEWYAVQFDPGLHARFPNPYAEDADRADVIRSHLVPLVRLLAEHARTGDALYRELYIGERRRYAPHRAGVPTLRQYFGEVIPRQEAAVMRALGSDTVQAWLDGTHRQLLEAPAGEPVRLLMIGDCLLGEIQPLLHARALERGIGLDFRYYYFSAQMGTDLLEDGIREALQAGVDLVAVSYLSYAGIPAYRAMLAAADADDDAALSRRSHDVLRFAREHLLQMRAQTDAPILLHNAGGLPLSRWRRLVPGASPISAGRRRVLATLNGSVAELAAHVGNCMLVDEAAVTARHGLRACARPLLPRRLARHADLHPTRFGVHLADEYLAILGDWAAVRRAKVLLVDFDNTLWDGVMADGPVRHHHERQRLLRRLAAEGILLVAVSKNDPANIRWGEMQLAPEDFVALRIGWGPKAEEIRAVAAALNLGLDAFVLVDDNPAERELVRLALPQVGLLDATRAETWRAIARLADMPNTRTTDEARRRTGMYRAQAERAAAVRTHGDHAESMAALGLRATIGTATAADLDRLTELVQRTNQFNTVPRRRTRGELEALLRDPHHAVLVGELADRFGALGIVCAAIVDQRGPDVRIEAFVMSCRAMGFGLEQSLLAEIVRRAGGRPVVGRFVASDRNGPASHLYPSAGFTERGAGEWVLPAGRVPPAPDWIALLPRAGDVTPPATASGGSAAH